MMKSDTFSSTFLKRKSDCSIINIFHVISHDKAMMKILIRTIIHFSRHCRWFYNCWHNNTFWTNDYYLSDEKEVCNAINLSNTWYSCFFFNPFYTFFYTKWLTYFLIYIAFNIFWWDETLTLLNGRKFLLIPDTWFNKILSSFALNSRNYFSLSVF